MTASVTFDTGARDGLKDADTLHMIRRFQHWAELQPEIDRSFGLPNFVEEMHWGFNAENPAFRTVPDDSRLISQYLLIYDGDDIHDFVDREFQHSQVALNLNVHKASEIARTLDRVREYLNENVGDRLHWEIAGNARLFADIEDLLVSGQLYSLWGALVLIFMFLLFFLRSAGAAALCMIPNLSPILLIFILMGAFGIWLDMATAMIASVAVGIAVDDTIHVYHGFRHRLARGVSPVTALARSYRHAGRAVVVTTIILSAQFLILVSSDFVPTRNFGLLTTVGLLAALLFDLLLLPALLITLHGHASPVAAWMSRLNKRKLAADVPVGDRTRPAFDSSYWTTERKTALVKEMLSGRSSATEAAQTYGVPQRDLERWVKAAERGIAQALAGGKARRPTEVRTLARAYKKLQAENRQLKSRGQG